MFYTTVVQHLILAQIAWHRKRMWNFIEGEVFDEDVHVVVSYLKQSSTPYPIEIFRYLPPGYAESQLEECKKEINGLRREIFNQADDKEHPYRVNKLIHHGGRASCTLLTLDEDRSDSRSPLLEVMVCLPPSENDWIDHQFFVLKIRSRLKRLWKLVYLREKLINSNRLFTTSLFR